MLELEEEGKGGRFLLEMLGEVQLLVAEHLERLESFWKSTLRTARDPGGLAWKLEV